MQTGLSNGIKDQKYWMVQSGALSVSFTKKKVGGHRRAGELVNYYCAARKLKGRVRTPHTNCPLGRIASAVWYHCTIDSHTPRPKFKDTWTASVD